MLDNGIGIALLVFIVVIGLTQLASNTVFLIWSVLCIIWGFILWKKEKRNAKENNKNNRRRI